jgi:hypothetical protein
MLAETEYPHRRNSDGTWDSICKHRFLTIAHCKTEGELAEGENTHLCDSALLADRGLLSEWDALQGTKRVPPTSTNRMDNG